MGDGLGLEGLGAPEVAFLTTRALAAVLGGHLDKV